MSEKKNETKRKHALFDTAVFSGLGSSRRTLKNVISKSFGVLTEKFTYTSTRAYGAMALSFGLLSLFIYLGKYYILTEPELSNTGLIIGLVFSVLALPLLFFEKPLCLFLQDFPPTSYIFFDFFSIKRIDKDDTKHGISVFSATLLGFIPALFSVFIPVSYVLLAVALLLFVSISFVTPEFTIVFTVLIAPYLSPIPDRGFTLAFLAILSVISFIMKLIIGKRFFHFEIYDIGFFLLAILVFVFGAINGTPFSGFVIFALTIGYFLTANLVTNRRLADCVANALIVSSLPISVIALVEYISALAKGESFSGKVLFSSPDSYGAFLLIIAVFASCYGAEAKGRVKRLVYFTAGALSIVNVILAWQAGLWLTLLLLPISYFIIKKPKIRKEWLVLPLVLPYFIFLIPEETLADVSDFLALPTGLDTVVISWKSGFDLICESIFTGCAESGSVAVYNVFLSLAMSLGIFVPALLLILFLFKIIQLSSFAQYVKNSDLGTVAKAAALGIFSLYSSGMTADIFSDITLFYVFASVFGILSAALRLSKNEHDERIGYYGTTRSDDSSDVNIRISV